MSIWKNGKLIAGGRQCMPLLSFMWADHQLNDISWLRADTFSWQSGAVYTAVYQHLVDDYNNIPTEATVYVYHSVSPVGYFYRDSYFDVSGANHPYAYARYNNDGSINVLYADHQTGETTDNYYENADGSGTYYANGFTSGSRNIRPVKHETINGNIISFYEAQDGHKIAPDKDTLDTINELPRSQESNVAAIYAATGVAWYYVLDTVNTRFKLPRSKHNKYANSLGVVGNGNTLGFIGSANDTSATRVIAGSDYHATMNTYTPTIGGGATSGGDWQHGAYGITTDPETSGMIAQQEQDTDQYKYLYFYVGQFTQTALENTAGLNTEMFNDLNAHKVIEFQEPTSANNYTWYRKYADGWVEQGGKISPHSGDAWRTCTLPITMASEYYNVYLSARQKNQNAAANYGQTYTGYYTTTGFNYKGWYNDNANTEIEWLATGIAA